MNPKANITIIAEFPEANNHMIMPTAIIKKFCVAFVFPFLKPLIPEIRKYAVIINPTQLKNVAKIIPPIFYLSFDNYQL